MSEFALVPGDMRSASSAVESSASDARGADGSGALSALSGALPGTTTAETMPELGTAWEDGVSGWSDEVVELSAAIDQLTADSESTDQTAGGWFDHIFGNVGGGG